MVADAYGCDTDAAFVQTLEDNIRKRGAMDKLMSDRAQAQVSKLSKNTLRHYCIDDATSEAKHQHQNPSEKKYGEAKANVNKVMNRVGAPAYTWLLCLLYVLYIMNRTALESLNWRTPLEVLTGSTPDVSPVTRFYFWEPVYYALNEGNYKHGTEATGRFVGFSENVGHAMTYKVLDDKTKKVLHRSRVRSALFDDKRNLRAEEATADAVNKDKIDEVEFIKARFDDVQGKMKTIDFDELIGRTFITPPSDDGSQYRAMIKESVETSEKDMALDPTMKKFRCTVDDRGYDEILTYNELMNFIEDSVDDGEGGVWRFKDVYGHRWTKGVAEVFLHWENGEKTWEPVSLIAKDDPITLAVYGKKHNLLEKSGWKSLKRHAKNDKVAARLLNQAKLRSFRTAPRYKYGFEVANNVEHALEIDRKTGTDRYKQGMALELGQLEEYQAMKDKGKDWIPPTDYKKIRCHMVFDIKHDGRHKARFVAGGHMTPPPLESVYSSIVSLRGIRLVTFLAEHNDLELWSTDIGNAYLEALTHEKVYFIAGPEFGERAGHKFVIVKALYGLKSSGLRWHDRLADVLRAMGFEPSRAEPDIWMRAQGTHYEYIAVYVDDLLIASKSPEAIIAELTDTYKFKLKGTGQVTFHLGLGFERDENGRLRLSPRRYIERMLDAYVDFFGNKPKQVYTSPLEKGDNPELDTSEELDVTGTKKYQSMIGALQWCISLGRLDIATAVMTMSSFRAAPRKGHLERLKRIYGYLAKMRHAKILVSTELPDWSDVPDQDLDWAKTTYGDVKEIIPDDIPEPLGKEVISTTYVDANLYHCKVTGRSVTGILHFVNGTVIDWYSKKQSTVETATYGSEFVAAKTAVDQITDLRITLRYLGVPIKGKAYLFGDNESVIKSSTVPHSCLKKRHCALSFHRVREAIASNMLIFQHLAGDKNPADILSKHWGYQQVWQVLRPVLFYNWAGRVSSEVKGSDKFSLPRASGEHGQAKTDKPSVHPPTVDAHESLESNETRDTEESRETNDTQDSSEAGDDDASGQWHLPLAGM